MPSLQRLTIRTRLRLGVVACVSLLAVLGLVSLIDLKSVDAGVTALDGDVLPRLAVTDTVAQGAQAFRQDQLQLLLAPNATRRTKLAGQLAEHEAAVESAFEGAPSDDAALTAWQTYVEQTRGVPAASRERRARALAIVDAATPSWDRLEAALRDRRALIRADARAVARSTQKTFRRSGLISFALTVLGVMVAAGMWFALGALAVPESERSESESEAGAAEPESPPETPDSAAPSAVDADGAARETAAAVEPMPEAVDDSLHDLAGDPLVQTERIGRIVTAIGALADTATELAHQAAGEADHGGEASPGLGLVADEVRTLSDDAKAAAARISATIDGLRVSQSVKALSDVAETTKGLLDQSHSIAMDIAVEAARAGAEGSSFDELAAAVNRMTDELEAHAGEADEVLRDVRAEHDLVEA